jgi:hypothetical protein
MQKDDKKPTANRDFTILGLTEFYFPPSQSPNPSYAEKKFWKIDVALPAATVLALFKKGFMFTDRMG